MNTTQKTSRHTQIICTTLFSFLLFFSFTAIATAQSAFTATIDVVDSEVIAGEPVTLQWYVTGGPASCNINHEVGDFAVTTDPEGGTVSAIPPSSGDPFVITCTRRVREMKR